MDERAAPMHAERPEEGAAPLAQPPPKEGTSGSAPEQEEQDPEEAERERRRNEAAAAALTLEIIGDLPHAEVKPPENVLFVCKLNPVTRSDDLELIFSRFGKVNSCEVIRDKKVGTTSICDALTAQTGDSLQYAFVEFNQREAAEQVRKKALRLRTDQQAYFKMQNVLIDDRRIWVDFSQSVSKLHNVWVKQRTGGRGRLPSGSGSRGAPSGSRGPPSSRGPPAPARPPMPLSAPGGIPGLLMDFGEMDPREERGSDRRDSGDWSRDYRSRDCQDDGRRDDRRRDEYRRDNRYREKDEDQHRYARRDDREDRYRSRRDYDRHQRCRRDDPYERRHHHSRHDEPYERRHRHYEDYPGGRGHREHGRSHHRDTPERREHS